MSRKAAALAIGLLGAALLAVGAAPWLSVPVTTAIAAEVLSVAGSAAAPAVPAAGLVLLAAGVALLLAGRVAQVGAALTVSAVGVVVAGTSVAVLTDPVPAAAAAAAAATGVRRGDVEPALTAWPLVAAVLGVLTVAGGAVVLHASRRWADKSGGRYERLGEPPGAARVGEGAHEPGRARAMDDWDALTRGEDPS